MIFSTSYMDSLAKIHLHHWKDRLKISKVAKFESDRMKTNKDIAPQNRKILDKNFATLEAISSLVSDIPLSNSASLLILRRSF